MDWQSELASSQEEVTEADEDSAADLESEALTPSSVETPQDLVSPEKEPFEDLDEQESDIAPEAAVESTDEQISDAVAEADTLDTVSDIFFIPLLSSYFLGRK